MQDIAGLQCLIAGATPARSRVILLHGRGASAHDLFSLGDHLPNRAQGIFPQAPYSFPFNGPPMGWAWYDMAPNQRPGLVASAEKLVAFLDVITQRDPARAAMTILGGFSQGGIMSLDVGLRYRPLLGGLVVMSGFMFDEERSFALPDASTPPVCMVHGIDDDLIDITRARQSHEALKARGVDVRYAEFPMGHEIRPESWEFVSGFLEERLGT